MGFGSPKSQPLYNWPKVDFADNAISAVQSRAGISGYPPTNPIVSFSIPGLIPNIYVPGEVPFIWAAIQEPQDDTGVEGGVNGV